MTEEGLRYTFGIDADQYIQGLELMQRATERLDSFLKRLSTDNLRDQFSAVLREAQITEGRINTLSEVKKKLNDDLTLAQNQGLTEKEKELDGYIKDVNKSLKESLIITKEWTEALEILKGRMGIQSKPNVEMLFGKEEREAYESVKSKSLSISKEIEEALQQKDHQKLFELNKQLATTVEILGKMESAAASAANALSQGQSQELLEDAAKIALDFSERVALIEQQQNRVAELSQQTQSARTEMEQKTEIGIDKDGVSDSVTEIERLTQELEKAKNELEEIKQKATETEQAYTESVQRMSEYRMSDTPMLLTVRDLELIELYREEISELQKEMSSSTDSEELAALNERLNATTESLQGIERDAAQLALERGPQMAKELTNAAESVYKLSKEFQRQSEVIAELEEEYQRLQKEMEDTLLNGGDPTVELSQQLLDAETKLHKARMERYDTAGKLSQARDRLSSDEHIHVRMTADSTGFQRANDDVLKGIREATGHIEQYQSSIQRVTSSIQRLAEFSIPAFSIAGITQFLTQVKNVRANFQDIESTMRVFLGDADKASAFVEDLERASYYNMFDFSQLVEGSKQMIAYGVATDQVIPRINQLSEIATATHASLGEMVSMYNRAKSLGFIDSRSLQSWATKGLVVKDVLKEMGENANVTKVSFDQFNKVLDHVTSEGGMFHGVMNEQMTNLNAEIGQLEDNMTLMKNEIGKSLEGPLRSVVKLAGEIVANWQKVAWAIGGATLASKAFNDMQSTVVTSSANEIKQWEDRLDNLDRRSKTLTLDKKIEDRLNAGLITKEQAERWQNAKNKVLDRSDSYDEKGNLKSVDALKKEADARAELADKIDKEIEARKRLQEKIMRDKAADKIDKDDEESKRLFDDEHHGKEGYKYQSNKDISDAVRSGAIDSDKAEELIRQRQAQNTNEIQRQLESVNALIAEREKEGLVLQANLDMDNQKAELARQAYEQSLENYGLQNLSQEKQKGYLDVLKDQVTAVKEMGEASQIVAGIEDEDGNTVETVMELADVEKLLSEAEVAETATKQALASAEAVETNQQMKENLEKEKGALSSRKVAMEEVKESVAHKHNADEIKKENILRRTGNQLKTIGTNLTNQLRNSIKGLWVTMATNPLGMILAALPMLISLYHMLKGETEETSEEMDTFGKAALDSANKTETLYAILENADKNSRVYKDALKELTKACQDYNIKLGKQDDVEKELIKNKERLLQLMLEEGRQKQMRAKVDDLQDEKSTTLYGDSDNKGVKGDIADVLKKKYDVDNTTAQKMGMLMAETLDKNAVKIEEVYEKLKDAQKKYDHTKINEYGEQLRQLTGANIVANTLSEKGINLATKDMHGLAVKAANSAGEVNELNEEIKEFIGLITESPEVTTAEKYDPTDIENNAKAYRSLKDSYDAAKEKREELEKSMSDSSGFDIFKEAAKKTEDSLEKVGDSIDDINDNPLEIEAEESSVEKAADSVEHLNQSIDDVNGNPVEINPDDTSVKQAAHSVEHLNEDIDGVNDNLIRLIVDANQPFKGNLFIEMMNENIGKVNENPIVIQADSSQVTQGNTVVDMLNDKIDKVNDNPADIKVDDSEVTEATKKAEKLEKEQDAIDNKNTTTHVNFSQLLEAIKKAKELKEVLTDIDGIDLFSTIEETKTLKEIANKYGFSPTASVSLLKKTIGDDGKSIWNKMSKEDQLKYVETKNKITNRNYITVGGKNLHVANEEDAAKMEYLTENFVTVREDGVRQLDFGDNEEAREMFKGIKSRAQYEKYKKQKEKMESLNKDLKTTANEYLEQARKGGYQDSDLQGWVSSLNNAKASYDKNDPMYTWLGRQVELIQRADKQHGYNSQDAQRAYQLQKALEQQKLQSDRQLKDNEFAVREYMLKAQATYEGASTEIEQLQADLKKEKDEEALRRKVEDEVKRKKDEERKNWVQGGRDRRENEWRQTRTDEEYEAEAKERIGYLTQLNQIELTHYEETDKINEKNRKAMLAYLKEYGTFKEKELAITQDYERQIEDAATEGEKLKLKKDMDKELRELEVTYNDGLRDFLAEIGEWQDKRDRAEEIMVRDLEKAGDNLSERIKIVKDYHEKISAFDMEEFKEGIGWETMFSDMDSLSQKTLLELRQKLTDTLEVDTEDISTKAFKEIMDQIDAIDDALEKRKGLWSGFFNGGAIEEQNNKKYEAEQASASVERWESLIETQERLIEGLRQQLAEKLEEKGVRDQEGNAFTADALDLGTIQEILKDVTDEGGELKGAFDQLIHAESELSESSDELIKAKDKERLAQEALQKNLWDYVDILESVTSTIGSNLASMQDLLFELGVDDSGFGESLTYFADAMGAASDAFSKFQNKDFIGALASYLKFYKSMGEFLGSLGIGGFGASDRSLSRDMERLTKSNEALREAIDHLYGELSDSRFSDAANVYKDIVKDIEEMMNGTREMMQRNAKAYNNGFYGIGGTKSVNAHVDKVMTEEDWRRVSEKAGVTVKKSSDFFKLTSEQMGQVATRAADLWAKIQMGAKDGYGEVADYMNEFKNYWEDFEKAADAFQQKVTNTSFDSVVSEFSSMLMDMDSDVDDFTESFENKMRQAVINAMIEDVYKEKLKTWMENWTKMMDEGLTDDEQAELQKQWKTIAEDALEKRNEMAKAMGWGKSGSQKGTTSGGFATATQDSVDELNGRFTAVQIETSAIRLAVDSINAMTLQNTETFTRINEGVAFCRMYGQQQLEELMQIRKNTSHLEDISDKIGKIEEHVQYI